jgi:hypothetical protein
MMVALFEQQLMLIVTGVAIAILWIVGLPPYPQSRRETMLHLAPLLPASQQAQGSSAGQLQPRETGTGEKAAKNPGC